MPQPTGFWNHVAPSSSENAMRLQARSNCETKVRPVRGEVQRMGSKLVREVRLELTFVQVAAAGFTESSNATRKVCRLAWYITLPVFKFTPIEGSPALVPKRAVPSLGTGG